MYLEIRFESSIEIKCDSDVNAGSSPASLTDFNNQLKTK